MKKLNPELNEMIEMALSDGVISPQEKKTLQKKANSLGIDSDELDIILDSKLTVKKKQLKEEKFVFRVASILFLGSLLLLVVVGYVSENWNTWFINEDTPENVLLVKTQNACDKKDFEKAHKCVNILYSKSYRYREYEKASDILFMAESQYLIAHIDEDTAMDRIVYLITGMPTDDVAKTNERCTRLLALAIGIDNEILARRIIPLFQTDAEGHGKDDIRHARDLYKEAFGHSYTK